MHTGKRIWAIVAGLTAAGAMLCGCGDDDFSLSTGRGASVSTPVRHQVIPEEDQRRVMILYSAGFNSLSSYLRSDIDDLAESDLPGNLRTDPVALVVSRQPESPGVYTQPVSPVMIRLYRNPYDGEPVRDTVKVWPESTNLSDAETFGSILKEIKSLYPAKSYGLIFSSHASGWLPPGYYNDPAIFETNPFFAPGRRAAEFFPPLEDVPAVKSLGQDLEGPLDNRTSHEMSLQEFADALPYHLDYILFDACLMGCVEVAYALKDKADCIGFSQAEVLAEGFDYGKMVSHLLYSHPSDVKAVCEDYFQQYAGPDAHSPYATIALADCSQMDAFAEVCAPLFEKYRGQISSMDASTVQGFFRFRRHFFYDLEDILIHAGITEEELAEFRVALDRVLLYKAATAQFIDFDINHFCGLTMYLPADGTAFLDDYYQKNIAWNKATGLIR